MPARIETLDLLLPRLAAPKRPWRGGGTWTTRRKLLAKDLKDITPAELQWQLRPGMNTIGMLLAHLAIVEVFWLHVAEGHATEENMLKCLGIGNRRRRHAARARREVPPKGLESHSISIT